MRGYETCREVDLPLPIEGIEQGDTERLGIGRQIVQPIFGAVARDAGERHVKITGEVERHRAMQDAAHGLEVAVLVCGLDPLKHPVDGVGIGEDVMGYRLRHTYICMRLMEGADIYQIAKNCRTSEEMIEKFYAAPPTSRTRWTPRRSTWCGRNPHPAANRCRLKTSLPSSRWRRSLSKACFPQGAAW